MSDKTIHVCDGCGKEAQNRYAAPGWIRVGGTIARSRGKYINGCWSTSGFLSSGSERDFCSLKCIGTALDKSNVKAEPQP